MTVREPYSLIAVLRGDSLTVVALSETGAQSTEEPKAQPGGGALGLGEGVAHLQATATSYLLQGPATM